MKVYILIYEDQWNDIHRVEGVYSSFQKAIAARKKILDEFNYEGIFGIREMTIDV